MCLLWEIRLARYWIKDQRWYYMYSGVDFFLLLRRRRLSAVLACSLCQICHFSRVYSYFWCHVDISIQQRLLSISHFTSILLFLVVADCRFFSYDVCTCVCMSEQVDEYEGTIWAIMKSFKPSPVVLSFLSHQLNTIHWCVKRERERETGTGTERKKKISIITLLLYRMHLVVVHRWATMIELRRRRVASRRSHHYVWFNHWSFSLPFSF